MKKNGLSYSKNTGYQMPPGYLENLEDRLFAKLATSDKTVSISEKAKMAFTVPDNYFDSFEDKLMAKLPATRKEPKLISLLNKEALYYVAGVAAVLIAIVVNTFTQQPEPFSLESLDMLTLENYIDESIDQSTPEVSRILSEGDFSLAPTGNSGYIDQEALFEYLHDNIEEPSLIFNED